MKQNIKKNIILIIEIVKLLKGISNNSFRKWASSAYFTLEKEVQM